MTLLKNSATDRSSPMTQSFLRSLTWIQSFKIWDCEWRGEDAGSGSLDSVMVVLSAMDRFDGGHTEQVRGIFLLLYNEG